MSDCQNDLQDEIDEAAMRRDNVAAAPGQPNDPVPVPVSFRDTKEIPGLRRYNLTDEAWREYDFGGRVYRIVEPIALYYRENGDTHRVVDSQGTTHCCPAPGNGDCVLRWGGGRFVSF